jgi:hypothetical protein
MNLHDAVVNLFKLLDATEENESGNIFHPTQISTCRAMEIEKLQFILDEMRREVGLSKDTK